MKILVTGGTVFVSRAAAAYFAAQGHDVSVLNRATAVSCPAYITSATTGMNRGLTCAASVSMRCWT